MINKRVKISNVVENQLPDFVKDTYPLATEFLKSYYRSQDSQGLPADIINSIDQYLKLENNLYCRIRWCRGGPMSLLSPG